jgi:hypothetical protein
LPNIEIDEWSDTGESSFKYVAPGHHPEDEFRAALRRWLADRIDEDEAAETSSALSVYRVWHRPAGDSGEDREVYHQCKETDPGAQPFTETEWT